jgi:hypothetical protein
MEEEMNMAAEDDAADYQTEEAEWEEYPVAWGKGIGSCVKI